jgi:hypothetical protein
MSALQAYIGQREGEPEGTLGCAEYYAQHAEFYAVRRPLNPRTSEHLVTWTSAYIRVFSSQVCRPVYHRTVVGLKCIGSILVVSRTIFMPIAEDTSTIALGETRRY